MTTWYSGVTGLSAAHKKTLKRIGASRIADLQPADLAPIPGLVAVEVIDAAKRATGDNFAGLSDEQLLERLNEGATTAVVHAVQARGLALVAGESTTVDVGNSLAATRHRRTGKPLRSTFRGREVIDPTSLVFTVEYSPRTLTALEDGEDPDTGTDWSVLAEEPLRVLAWALQHPSAEARAKARVLGRRTDTEIIAAVRAGESWWMRVVASAPRSSDEFTSFTTWALRDGCTLSQRESSGPEQRMSVPSNPETALYNLLLELFTPRSFASFARRVGGAKLAHSLPGSGVPPATFMDEAVAALRRRGQIGPSLFTEMRADFPHQAAIIDATEMVCCGGNR